MAQFAYKAVPFTLSENPDGLTFHIGRDSIKVPDRLLNDDIFLKHFAEDFLTEPDPVAFQEALAQCSITFIHNQPIDPEDYSKGVKKTVIEFPAPL